MKRSKRMAPVRQLKQQEERVAAKKFANAQQEVQREMQQLQMLEKYQGDYFSSLHSNQGQSGPSMSAQQLDKYQLFLARLHKAIENQRQVLVIKEKGLEVARREWAEANARLKALDSLVEKMVQEEERAQDKQEQRLIDDLPLRSDRYI